MKYKFAWYYKYAFVLELEDGTKISNEEQSGGDIYKMSIEAEGEATETEDGKYLVDGWVFTQ